MPIPKQLTSRIVGPALFGRTGKRTFFSLTVKQPLLLIREPTNPVDLNAVIVATVNLESAGYLRRPVAAKLAPYMDLGIVFFAEVTRAQPDWPFCRIWRDEAPAAPIGLKARRKMKAPIGAPEFRIGRAKEKVNAGDIVRIEIGTGEQYEDDDGVNE